MRRFKEEPLIPIGALATVAAFTGAYRAMRRGDHHQVQRMFRARVAAQAFTVVAMVVGGMYYSADRHKAKELWKMKELEDAEEKRQKWIRELEVRDAEDKALKERMEKRRKKATERAALDSESVSAHAKAALEASTDGLNSRVVDGALDRADVSRKDGGIFGSLGGLWGSSRAGSEQLPSTPPQGQKPATEPAKK